MFRRLIEARSNGTTLVSLYAKAGTKRNDLLAKVDREYATSKNIKDSSVRKDVQSALKMIDTNLRSEKLNFENGYACF